MFVASDFFVFDQQQLIEPFKQGNVNYVTRSLNLKRFSASSYALCQNRVITFSGENDLA
jgi:hypothetical protein